MINSTMPFKTYLHGRLKDTQDELKQVHEQVDVILKIPGFATSPQEKALGTIQLDSEEIRPC